MSKANVDPTELRRFAADLKRFTGEIESLVGQLHARMNGLEGSWRDQEQKKFAEAFSQTAKALATFVEAAGEHSVFLNKKAAAIELYLRQRYARWAAVFHEASLMPGQVKVDDFEVFRLFRVALLKFAQAAEQALANADGQIVGMHSWLETEQSTYWQGQLRKRREAVTMAREEVRKKTLYKDSTGHTPSAVDEQKALARCVAAVAQAEEKILAVRKWLPRLEKETELYRGGVSRLSADVGGEIPRAVALLDRLAVRLEEYVQIETPAGGFAESATVGAEAAAAAPIGVESMSRGGEGREPAGESQRQENQSPAATLPAVDGESGTAPPLPADPTPATEGRHVADGE